jgi:Fe-Mn family superoxide dismutase
MRLCALFALSVRTVARPLVPTLASALALCPRPPTQWGSLDAFKTDMNATSAAVQGSGWGWLAWDPKEKGLRIVTCANQDPCSTTGTVPLLGIDVWEHAYYLDYKNVRPDYLKAIWGVVNWGTVASRFVAATK